MLPSLDSPRPLFTTPCRDMGIDALRRVTHEIVTNVQTLVGAPPPPASKYADLLLSLHTAFGQGFAIIGGLINASAPVNRLPRELLTNVFALSPGPFIPHGALEKKLVYWPFKTETNVGDLHKLTKVCRYWRDLAITSPTLWTTIGTFRRDDRVPFFRRSKYLPTNLSLALTIHLNTSSRDPPASGDLLDFVLKNTPSIRVREFHAWDTASMKDHILFLKKFDTRALEHCTLLGQDQCYDNRPLSNTRFLPFFPDGGSARLRSLCLIYPDLLPTNEFPALTLLVIAGPTQSHITMGDLFRFLAGCPRLEEAYIYDIIQRNPSPTSPTSPPPIALPHLKYLCYTYCHRQNSGWQKGADPIEHLLSRISIPSTCHMYFTVDGTRERHYAGTHDRYDGTSSDILKSVSRHIHGKDAVSRAFIWLATGSDASTMQFVFPQGSVRLQFGCEFTCVNTLRSLAPFLSQVEDVRVRYTSSRSFTDLVCSLARTLPTTFPNLKVLSLIRQNAKTSDNPWAAPSDGRSQSVDPVHLLHWYLVQTPRPSSPPAPEADRTPWHPKLDTLWVSVRSETEIASLQETLAGRAALGFPIRRVIVHHGFAGDSDSEALALLRALEEHAEEVILMQTRASRFDSLREVDWAERLADRFELPAALREGWPVRWHETEGDAHHQIEEGSDSDLDLDLDSEGVGARHVQFALTLESDPWRSVPYAVL